MLIFCLLGLFSHSGTAQAICVGEEHRSSAAALQIEREWPLRPSHDVVTRYLQKLAVRLIPKRAEWLKWFTPQDWPVSGWRIFTVRDLTVNAFSVGDGRIYITDGSFSFVNNEAELAAILAHEIAHQLAGHFCGRQDRPGSAPHQIGTLVQIIDIDKEIEADAIALGILESAGFPARAILSIVSRLPVTGNAQQHRFRLNKLNEKLAGSSISAIVSSSHEFLQLKNALPY
ncbi:MAG: M48 family metallopeptidase [Gammaproteobacteria bacterium]